MSETVRGLCVNNSRPMAGAVSARLPYRDRCPMGPPSAPPAAVAGNGAQTLPGDCFELLQVPPFSAVVAIIEYTRTRVSYLLHLALIPWD